MFASGSRYLVLMLQVASSFVVAHHVSPDQFGLTVLGNGALLVVTALRDLGTVGYLVNQREIDEYQIRSAFTLSLLVTTVASIGLATGAGPVAAFYQDQRLVGYLRLMACAYALGPFLNPITALLTRDLQFRKIAVIEVGSGLANAITAIVLIRSGYGFVSVAWGMVARAIVGLVLGFVFRPGLTMLRPSLRHWRAVLHFGVHGSATAIVYNIGEALVYLVVGKVASIQTVGLLQRSYILTQIPERALLAGVGAVALPAFAAIAREERPVLPAYLYTIRMVVPVYLAAMLALVILARPLIEVTLGPNWTAAIGATRILAAGHLVGAGAILNLTILVAVGGIRWTTPLAVLQFAVLLVSILVAAPFGLLAIAGTAFVTMPVFSVSSYLVVRWYVPFAWTDVGAAMRPGLIAAACGIAPATAIVLWGGLNGYPLAVLVLSAAAGAVTWLAALRRTAHPLHDEIARLGRRLRTARVR